MEIFGRFPAVIGGDRLPRQIAKQQTTTAGIGRWAGSLSVDTWVEYVYTYSRSRSRVHRAEQMRESRRRNPEEALKRAPIDDSPRVKRASPIHQTASVSSSMTS